MNTLASSEMDLKKPETDTSFDAVFPTREQFLESCKSQAFSLPIHIMEYIWSNPSSPEVYEKLIKSCKLFFLKNPILVMKNLEYHSTSGWVYCNAEECCEAEHEHEYFNMDENEGRIWVTKHFVVSARRVCSFDSNAIAKMYRNDIKILELSNQILSYGELKYLVSGVEECNLYANIVKYGNGEEVPVNEIIKLFSGAKYVTLSDFLDSSIIACKSYADLVDACGTVENVYFTFIPRSFDVREFYQQMKLSKSRVLVSIQSCFNGPVFDAVMDEIADEIFATESFDFIPPVIKYVKQNEAIIEKMKEIQAREAAKYR